MSEATYHHFLAVLPCDLMGIAHVWRAARGQSAVEPEDSNPSFFDIDSAYHDSAAGSAAPAASDGKVETAGSLSRPLTGVLSSRPLTGLSSLSVNSSRDGQSSDDVPAEKTGGCFPCFSCSS